MAIKVDKMTASVTRMHHVSLFFFFFFNLYLQPQWGTADAEIKNPLVGAKGYQRFPLFKPGVGI